jgi:hypothetical protein
MLFGIGDLGGWVSEFLARSEGVSMPDTFECSPNLQADESEEESWLKRVGLKEYPKRA